MTNPLYTDFTFTAIQAALSAGEILRRGFDTSYQVFAKGKHNPVTEFDKAAEKQIISTIRARFPDHAFLAEESGASEQSMKTVTWIIDPLDGTLNFSRHIPIFNTSIAAYADGKIVAGVVYQPITHELFVAERGKGAFLNGKRISVSRTSAFDDAVVGIGFPRIQDEALTQMLSSFSQMIRQGNPLREIGSAALNLAYLAAGRFDIFWIGKLYPWDVAAGQLLIEEAGGSVSNFEGNPYPLLSEQPLIATNGLLHAEMVQFIHSYSHQ